MVNFTCGAQWAPSAVLYAYVHLFRWDKRDKKQGTVDTIYWLFFIIISVLEDIQLVTNCKYALTNESVRMKRLWPKKVRPTPLTFPGSRPGNTARLMITDSFLLIKCTAYVIIYCKELGNSLTDLAGGERGMLLPRNSLVEVGEKKNLTLHLV